MFDTLETAKYWKSLGIATIPIQWKSKQPRVKWLPYTEQLPTDNELNYWYGSGDSNIAIVTGWKNLLIIDFDDMEVFMKWYYWAVRSGGKAKTVATETRIHRSARGAHVFVLCENAENAKLPKIDILAHRKYALLPPSLHPSGVPYKIYRGGLPMPIQSLYDVLPKALADSAVKSAQKVPAQGAPSPSILSGQNFSKIPYDPWEEAGKAETDSKVIDQIKNQIRITDILSGQKMIDTGGNGRWKMCCCPFHDDKNPSMWIDTEKQLCGCQAGCTPLPLDVIDLYAKLNGIDNFTAIRELAKRL